MAKTLVIAEKPSVARDLATVLGQFQKRRGYLENQQYLITWAVGHLVGLAEPEDYDQVYRRWAIKTLPIIPESFQLKVLPGGAEQYAIVAALLNRLDTGQVINACDAGREGELIFRYIYQQSRVAKPVQRLWISSLTPDAIREGFQKLQPAGHYDRLAQAARCRSESDWLIGINATRVFTVKNRLLLTIGRVQTPTLALLVRREEEIQSFIPEGYWEVWANFGVYRGKWFKAKEERLISQAAAAEISTTVSGGTGLVTSVDKQVKRELPPHLFDLNELQREANKKFGFSAAKTLKIAQSLYENRKLLTYPRTDSRFLPEEYRSRARQTLDRLAAGGYGAEAALAAGRLGAPGKRVFNNAGVSDHHALVPTPVTPQPGKLTADEQKIFDLVVKRFLAAFYPAAVYEETKIITTVNGHTFKTTGKTWLEPGWRQVYGMDAKRDEDAEGTLPPINTGEQYPVQEVEIKEKTTQPPARYTDASLLKIMEKLKLGTPATRAAIIERLAEVGFIIRQKKSLQPTPKGIELVRLAPDDLRSPELTAEWEKKLAKVEKGLMEQTAFMSEIRDFTIRITMEALQQARTDFAWPAGSGQPPKLPEAVKGRQPQSGQKAPDSSVSTGPAVQPDKSGASSGPVPDNTPEVQDNSDYGVCPLCGAPVRENSRAYFCARWQESCPLTVWKEVAGKKLTLGQVQMLLQKGQTSLLKGFKSKKGKIFAARLKLDKGKVVFDF